ncbi:protein sprouty homolog 2 isoform X2 [Mauremys reevesii]|uniref:protein sprouty homolog 2 isoform X2 n=1 Tax=Mauremys reevesii TaxID=260615 RepID=UPI00193F4194|nr:protein sprouty homolog 2 isoform X2 [Mauremys reevesii]
MVSGGCFAFVAPQNDFAVKEPPSFAPLGGGGELRGRKSVLRFEHLQGAMSTKYCKDLKNSVTSLHTVFSYSRRNMPLKGVQMCSKPAGVTTLQDTDGDKSSEWQWVPVFATGSA